MGEASRQLFVIQGNAASVAEPALLSDAGIRERQDLQEWVIAHPEVLGDDVLIVTAEFDRWESDSGGVAKERLDLLGLDPSGRLVVVELKRDEEPRIRIKAITSTALVSDFTEETLADVHADFANRRGSQTSQDDALTRLRDHVEVDVDAGCSFFAAAPVLAPKAQVVPTRRPARVTYPLWQEGMTTYRKS